MLFGEEKCGQKEPRVGEPRSRCQKRGKSRKAELSTVRITVRNTVRKADD